MSRESRKSAAGSVFDFKPMERQLAQRLETRRDKCVEQRQYREAGKLHRELESMLGEHDARESDKFRKKQLHEQAEMLTRQAEDLRDFSEGWSKRIQDFEKRVDFLRSEFKSEQKEANKKHLAEIRSSTPCLKTSKQLTFLRNQAASLAKLQKFDEADFIKNELLSAEREEKTNWQLDVNRVSRMGGKKAFINSQTSARQSFENKIELDWTSLNVRKRKETEQLLKRQTIQRARFFAKVGRDINFIEPLLTKNGL